MTLEEIILEFIDEKVDNERKPFLKNLIGVFMLKHGNDLQFLMSMEDVTRNVTIALMFVSFYSGFQEGQQIDKRKTTRNTKSQ